MPCFRRTTARKRLTGGFWIVLIVVLLAGCRVQSPSGVLESDLYQILHTTRPELVGQNVFVRDLGDSLEILIPQSDQRRSVHQAEYGNWTLRRTEIDVDVFTLPFKIRPARRGLPAQLNSNFNAAFYAGRRIDLYNYRWKRVSPSLAIRQLRSRGFGYGLFAGIGSSSINDFVTHSPIGVEYEGVVLDVGLATIYDARVFNVGLAVGVDHLLDANRKNWIYQHRPWFGVLFGLNLN